MTHKTTSHKSFFSYDISEPYPFRWFTPLAICLMIIATILFSLLNVAASGYILVVQSTNDPNTTLSEYTWLSNWPSFVTSKTRESCQPVNIPVNTKLFTNNTALTYELLNIWQVEGGKQKVLYSLPYYNNILDNCSLFAIDMIFDSQDRSPIQLSYSEWGLDVRSYITCSINDGRTHLNLTVNYNYVPEATPYGKQASFLSSGFGGRDKDHKASLYWGESLLSMLWAHTCREMQDQVHQIKEPMGKGSVYWLRNATSTRIDDPYFFGLEYQFIQPSEDSSPSFYGLDPSRDGWSVESLAAREAFPNIWLPADALAKATYSTVLTDLGQVDAPNNLLANPNQLEYFTANFSQWSKNISNAKPGPATEDYATLKDTTGPLGVSPAVFLIDYICQVPRQKSIANMIVSVLVADLVFLRAKWSMFKLIVDYFFVKKTSSSTPCDSCHAPVEEIPLREGRLHEDAS